jgi:hypothetical protein
MHACMLLSGWLGTRRSPRTSGGYPSVSQIVEGLKDVGSYQNELDQLHPTDTPIED